MELTLLGLGKEAVCAESPEDFSDMLLVGGHVSGVDEDIVQVYYSIMQTSKRSEKTVFMKHW